MNAVHLLINKQEHQKVANPNDNPLQRKGETMRAESKQT